MALLTLVSCAKQNRLSNQALFSQIQVHETRIAGGELAVRSADDCRAAHSPAEQEVCDPSVELCKLTDGIKDKDAARRCLIASDTCRAARERVRALCATPATP